MEFRYRRLEDLIVESVRRSTEGRDVAVAFSGGLDSGLVSALAKRYANSVHLYTCGTANAYDVVMAREMAGRLDLPWTHVQISKGNVEDAARGLISATGTSGPFTVSYELPLYCVCRDAEEDVVVTGQGADEYFMGCAKFVGCSYEDYIVLRDASVDRLLDVSVPCERLIADHFGKSIEYPYMDPEVVSEVGRIDPEELRPTDMDSRKAVLKAIALDLGFPFVADRKKKSSQYGSGTTDLVRALARERGLMYNQYIQCIYDSAIEGTPASCRGSVVNVRVDSVLVAKAERILRREGVTPSEAVEALYRRIVEDDGLDSIIGDDGASPGRS